MLDIDHSSKDQHHVQTISEASGEAISEASGDISRESSRPMNEWSSNELEEEDWIQRFLGRIVRCIDKMRGRTGENGERPWNLGMRFVVTVIAIIVNIIFIPVLAVIAGAVIVLVLSGTAVIAVFFVACIICIIIELIFHTIIAIANTIGTAIAMVVRRVRGRRISEPPSSVV